jgi:hypothetical protein
MFFDPIFQSQESPIDFQSLKILQEFSKYNLTYNNLSPLTLAVTEKTLFALFLSKNPMKNNIINEVVPLCPNPGIKNALFTKFTNCDLKK